MSGSVGTSISHLTEPTNSACSLAFTMFYICFDQMQNNLISQASNMNTGSTPNDILPNMNQVACILISPLVAYVLDPLLARRKKYLKPVTRIAIGFGFVTLTMVYAALVQNAIYKSAPCFDKPTACGDRQSSAQERPNVWIQAPLYFLMAAGEVFAMTTAMEYAEKHAPKNMEVFVQAIGMLITGIGSTVALVIAEAARDPYLVYFYAALAVGMFVTAITFYIAFRKCDQEEPEIKDDLEQSRAESTGNTFPTDTSLSYRVSDSTLSNDFPEKDVEVEGLPKRKKTATTEESIMAAF
jgi:POT family proton-dependent oligopeptide transporter